MALRETDAWDYLRLKNTFVESSSEAVFQDGRRLPVLIRDVGGVQQCAVEIGEQLHEAQKVSGFLRFEKIPEPVVEPPPPAEPTEKEIYEARLEAARKANPGVSGWVLQKQVTAQMFREGLARQQQATKQQQGIAISDRWRGFAEQAQRERNATFGQR